MGEIQKVIRRPMKVVRRASVRRNPLTNMKALMKLNPYSAVVKKSAAKVAAARQKNKEALLAKKRGTVAAQIVKQWGQQHGLLNLATSTRWLFRNGEKPQTQPHTQQPTTTRKHTHTTTHNHAQPRTTTHNHTQPHATPQNHTHNATHTNTRPRTQPHTIKHTHTRTIAHAPH